MLAAGKGYSVTDFGVAVQVWEGIEDMSIRQSFPEPRYVTPHFLRDVAGTCGKRAPGFPRTAEKSALTRATMSSAARPMPGSALEVAGKPGYILSTS